MNGDALPPLDKLMLATWQRQLPTPHQATEATLEKERKEAVLKFLSEWERQQAGVERILSDSQGQLTQIEGELDRLQRSLEEERKVLSPFGRLQRWLRGRKGGSK
jgi:hypothetical protein